MSGMSTEQILDEIKQMGMQNKDAYYIQQAFQKIKHGPWGGHIPQDAKDLCKSEVLVTRCPSLLLSTCIVKFR